MSDPTQVHVTPATSSDERMHELSDRCWCRPLNEFVTNAATGRNDWVIRHYAPVAAAADAPQPEDAATPVPLEKWAITPTCRFNRGDDGAWDEAVAQLRQVYDAQVQRFGPAATLTLAIFRERAEGVPQYVYEACLPAGPSPAVLPEKPR